MGGDFSIGTETDLSWRVTGRHHAVARRAETTNGPADAMVRNRIQNKTIQPGVKQASRPCLQKIPAGRFPIRDSQRARERFALSRPEREATWGHRHLDRERQRHHRQLPAATLYNQPDCIPPCRLPRPRRHRGGGTLHADLDEFLLHQQEIAKVLQGNGSFAICQRGHFA